MKSLLHRLNTPPGLGIIGFVVAVRTFIFGLGFATGSADAVRTLLYGHINALPFMTAEIFGVMLMLAGLALVLGFVFKKKEIVKYSSQWQFMVYMFTGTLYLVTGSVYYALTAAFPWAIIIAVVSLAYYRLPKRRKEADEREFYDLPSDK
jgi:hypothetical protein